MTDKYINTKITNCYSDKMNSKLFVLLHSKYNSYQFVHNYRGFLKIENIPSDCGMYKVCSFVLLKYPIY